jgi:putative lipoic acid-binding regulatory protein
MNKIGDLHDLKTLLDAQGMFPKTYTFKFIVPHSQLEELLSRLEGNKNSTKDSSKGKYTCVTSIINAKNSNEVIHVYQNVSDIEGIFSL